MDLPMHLHHLVLTLTKSFDSPKKKLPVYYLTLLKDGFVLRLRLDVEIVLGDHPKKRCGRNNNGAENRNVQFCSAEDEGFRNEVAEGEEVREQRQIVYDLFIYVVSGIEANSRGGECPDCERPCLQRCNGFRRGAVQASREVEGGEVLDSVEGGRRCDE